VTGREIPGHWPMQISEAHSTIVTALEFSFPPIISEIWELIVVVGGAVLFVNCGVEGGVVCFVRG
jgi:hypothetical protein